jgi:hypothetical protein
MSRRSRRYRSGAITIVVAAIALLALALPSQAELAGSNFESTDGNLTVEGTPPNGGVDWVNAPTRVRKDEEFSGTQDDAFGQGAKEDISCPTEVTGSIPPNKSNLSRFYVSHETGANGHFYVYLAWERTNVLGSANMDFEFNQSTTLCDNEPLASAVPIRTAGDILITFDFTNGGGNPVLGLLTWVASGPKSQCFAANSTPCWGNRVDLSTAGFADGAVNTVDVTDPIANVALPALTFGEAAIDLTAANAIPAGGCNPIASLYLKSRSSASFPAELKDFVPPTNPQFSSCGAIQVTKTYKHAASGSGPHPQADVSFTVNGVTKQTDANGVACFDGLAIGTYTVHETVPAGYVVDGNDKSVTVDNVASCTDTPYVGETVSFHNTPLTDITVSINSQIDGGTSSTISCTNGGPSGSTGANGDGSATATGLLPGTYVCTVVIDP